MAAAEATAKPRTRKSDAFEARIVHAYRREPYLVRGADDKHTEKDVEVVCCGERVKFRSNEAGHIVATVTTEAAFKRLVNEIPEAYIEYDGGENIPEKKIEAKPEEPKGAFVLSNGEKFIVLDGMDDEALRAFAKTNALDDFPEILTGDTLRRAIYNTLTTG
jgi:hypothetical protein